MNIDLSARLIFGGSALLLTLGILLLIRNGSLKEKYALLWLPLSVFFLVFGLFPSLLLWVAQKVHLHYITIVLLCVIMVFTYMLLYITLRLSQMREDMKKLAQELALTQNRFVSKETSGDSASWSVGHSQDGKYSPTSPLRPKQKKKPTLGESQNT